jgi:hypothetical protein
MNPGDGLTDDRWVTDTADVYQYGQVVYVTPPGEWHWARDIEADATGGKSPAVAQEFVPAAKSKLVEFLLREGIYHNAVAKAAGVQVSTVRKQATRLGLTNKAPPIGIRATYTAQKERRRNELDEWRDRLYAWAEAEKENRKDK